MTAVHLDSLSYGELAVAIHAAATSPLPWGLPAEQIKSLALAGIARLGIAEIRRINAETRLINLAYCGKIRADASADVSGETQAHHRIWGTWRREQVAVDLAYRLSCALQGPVK